MLLTKMQCSGADYLFADCYNDVLDNPSALAAKVCDRHLGVGSLGLVLLLYSNDADFRIEIYDSYGAKVSPDPAVLCCAVAFAGLLDIPLRSTVSFDTDSGIKYVVMNEDGSCTVNAGLPVLTPQLIPVDYTGDCFIDKVVSVKGIDYRTTCLSLAERPYAVVFTENGEELNDLNLKKIAPYFEAHNIFPVGTNVVFANVVDNTLVQERCWLFGDGESVGDSFGAVAAYTAAWLNKLSGDKGTVETLGGDVLVEVSDDDFVYFTSKGEKVFDVQW